MRKLINAWTTYNNNNRFERAMTRAMWRVIGAVMPRWWHARQPHCPCGCCCGFDTGEGLQDR